MIYKNIFFCYIGQFNVQPRLDSSFNYPTGKLVGEVSEAKVKQHGRVDPDRRVDTPEEDRNIVIRFIAIIT
jgi:hypothetical protein